MKTSTESTNTSSLEELIGNIQKMMDEVEAIVDNAPDGNAEAGHRISDLQKRLSNATSRLGNAYQLVRNRVITGTQKADESIREHPYESLAVAIGFGILVGALLRRRD